MFGDLAPVGGKTRGWKSEPVNHVAYVMLPVGVPDADPSVPGADKSQIRLFEIIGPSRTIRDAG